MVTRVRLASIIGLVLLAAAPAGAQYFGRNKVQYDRFDFRILETPHFDIYYYSAEREASLVAARMAERWYGRLSRALDHTFDHRQPIVLYASHGHFAQTSITPMFLTDGIGGLTDHQAGRVVLPFAAGLAETDHVLGHELVHAFQRDILKRHGSSLALMPLWFAEGMAEYLSVGRIDTNTAMWLRDSVNAKRLPRLEDLNNPRWFPYRYGQAVWAYLSERFGESIAARALKTHAKGNALARIATEAGVSAAELSDGWERAMHQLADRTTHGELTRTDPAIVSPGRTGGHLNVGPSLSPDGSSLVFLSERDGYSVDVFLADAHSGAIRRKLLSTAADAHFDSIQFIESAGAWDATGTQFALATLRDGVPTLMIFDMPAGTLAREVPTPGLDEIFTPTWSPDSSQVAFSALRGGATDIYAVTIATGAVRALTADLFADLQPAWSPDGSRIAFVTDRYTSSLDALTFGDYRLAAIDVATGVVHPLPSIPDAKNIDPHFSPEGRELYFVADHNGVSNIYRVSVDGGDARQMTDVQTGVSGITALSPAISVATQSGAVAYAAYRDGSYEIRALGAADNPQQRVQQPLISAQPPHLLSDVGQLVPQPSRGEPTLFLEKPYARKLSLLSIGQPYVSAGGGAFGSFVRAGISFGLGDMLGQQELETALQVGKDSMDFAVQAAYLNRRSRWMWGGIGGQIPMITGVSQTMRQTAAGPNGDATITRESVFAEQIHRQVSGLLMYPFSRAQRLELSAGTDVIGFRTDSQTSVFAAASGRMLSDSRVARSDGSSVVLLQTAAALVYDTAVHGPTSPVLGERFRLGIAPTFGDLHLATLVADLRKYMMPLKPFTIALRLQHVGRYGPDAADPRLLPFVWYVQDTVRGFDGRNLPAPGCNRVTVQGCDTIDAATTRKLLAGNLEVRFPIFGAFRRTASYGPVPLEGLLFTDAGAFWTGGSNAAPAVTTTLRSAGAGVRVNAGGFVFEFDAARPIAMPNAGWRMSVNFRPGF